MPNSSDGRERSSIVVLHVYGRMDRGGSETRSVEMLSHIKGTGIRTIYCTLARDDRAGALDESIKQLGATVVRCPLTRGFSRRFKQLLIDEGVTALHGHVQNFSGLLALYASQVKVPVRIVHWHTTGAKVRSFRKRIQDGIMKRLIDRFATRIVSVGEGAMEVNWPKWRSDARCKILYSGVDLRRFEAEKPKKTRGEIGLNKEALVIVHIGRFHPVKNQNFLIDLLPLIREHRPDAQLLLLGSGESTYEAEIRERAKLNGVEDCIRYAGNVAEVAEYLPVADLMIFPSVHEGLPGSVLEALAAGIPVLASDLPGVREIQRTVTDVRYLSLDDAKGKWVECALGLANQYESGESRLALKHALEKSHFNLECCVRGHIEVWEGG